MHFVKPCKRNIRAEDAAAAAARARSGYIPAMQSDGLDDMLRGINPEGVQGQSEGRAAERISLVAGGGYARTEQQYIHPPPVAAASWKRAGGRLIEC